MLLSCKGLIFTLRSDNVAVLNVIVLALLRVDVLWLKTLLLLYCVIVNLNMTMRGILPEFFLKFNLFDISTAIW